MNDNPISSCGQMIDRITRDAAGWPYAWFRGEPSCANPPLVPRLYRPRADGTSHDENQLLQFFRMRAPTYASGHIPAREATDQWLFLAQHVGLPTRLLDWSEGALVALYFALREKQPVIWMLNPIELNKLSVSKGHEQTGADFPLTWFEPDDPLIINIGHENICGAWEKDNRGVELPVAICPTNIHPRMSVQRSCFTVHGKNKESMAKFVSGNNLKRYVVSPDSRESIKRELRLLGIDHSTVFPDLDGLARELRERF